MLNQDIDGDGLPDADEAGQGCEVTLADAALYAAIDYPSDGASFRTTPILLSGQISSAYVDAVVISTNGGTTFDKVATITGLTWSFDWTPTSGTYTVQAKAANVFGGSTTTDSISVSYLSNSPNAAISSPVPEEHIDGMVSIEGTATGGLLGFRDYVVDYVAGTDPAVGFGWTTLVTSVSEVTDGTLYGSWDVSGLADGPHVVRLRVTDGAEIQTMTTHVIVQVDHDAVAPVTPWELSIEGGVHPTAVADGNSVEVVGSAPPNCFIETAQVLDQADSVLKDVTADLTLHGSGAIRGSFTLPGSLTATAVSLRLRVRDAVGNQSGWKESNELPVDNSGPAVTITFPLDTSTLPQDLIVVSGQASDIGPAGLSMVEFSTNGADYVTATGLDNWSYLWTPPSDGSYTLYVRGTDNLGNAAVSTVGVAINAAYPSAYITSPTQGEVINEGAQVAITGTAADSSDFQAYKVQYAAGVSPSTGWSDITPGLVLTPVQDGLLTTWDTTGVATGIYTIRLIVLDDLANIVIFDMQIAMITQVHLAGIPNATLNEGESIEDFVHLPDYASVLAGDPETLTYTITGNTAPGCGVSIDGSNNIDIAPTAGWSGTSTVTVEASNGPESDDDTFLVTVVPITPLLVYVGPSMAWPGHTLDVLVQGAYTHFDGTSQISFGAGIQINSVTVVNAAQLTANITVSWSATEGSRNVTVVTGSENVVARVSLSLRPWGQSQNRRD